MRLTAAALRNRSVRAALACAVLAGVGLPARADDIYLGKEGAELPLKNVTLRNVKDGELYYSTSTRGEAHRPVSEIGRLELTGETQFNAAERAFSEARSAKDEATAKQKYGEAVTGYTTTLSSTNKAWLRDFIAARMQVAGPRSGRFDAALAGWKAIAEKDPAAAMKAKPSTEGIDPKSQYLANAAKDLQASAAAAAGKPEVRKAYLDLLLDVQKAMGDTEGAIKTAEAKVQISGSPEEIAALAVSQAQNDVANRRYDAAAERLGRADLAALPEPARGDAAFVLAECRAAKLPPNAPADQWKDVAIDYMRVVAGYPASPSAPAALLKVAEIFEKLKEPETALKVYQQVAREHANTPAAQAAQKNIERLGGRAAGRG
jgi:TolA-binding protein